jgi:hypothetical protein
MILIKRLFNPSPGSGGAISQEEVTLGHMSTLFFGTLPLSLRISPDVHVGHSNREIM